MKFTGKNDESIEVIEITKANISLLNNSQTSELSLLWFTAPNSIINIDSVDYTLAKNQLISFTEFHNITIKSLTSAKLIRWSRAFYCVVDHDSEVSCKGILFYGASTIPVIKPTTTDLEILNTVYKMLLIEMKLQDNLQLEMLQMMLKRTLILCTRIYKSQNTDINLSIKNADIIREYNFLVEQHFKTKHTVKEYANLLFKSPKTLSNLFKKNNHETPLKFIHNRIMLEARRLLYYTDKSISEISTELGFSDIQTFSRFFKKQEGVSPVNFKNREILPKL